jgi:hypothetical protein
MGRNPLTQIARTRQRQPDSFNHEWAIAFRRVIKLGCISMSQAVHQQEQTKRNSRIEHLRTKGGFSGSQAIRRKPRGIWLACYALL